jgi:hypothetical protein
LLPQSRTHCATDGVILDHAVSLHLVYDVNYIQDSNLGQAETTLVSGGARTKKPGAVPHPVNLSRFGPGFAKEVGMGYPAEENDPPTRILRR